MGRDTPGEFGSRVTRGKGVAEAPISPMRAVLPYHEPLRRERSLILAPASHLRDNSSKLDMHLPRELLDEIFSHLPSDGGRSLKICSLVSKSWLEPSQRLLFSNISIDVITYQPWLDNISPGNTGLLRHVRSLAYFLQRYGIYDSRCRIFALRDYFPSFRNLQDLTFRNMGIEPAIGSNLEMFSAFQYTLSSLRFIRVSIVWNTLVPLIGFFPHLRILGIHDSQIQVENRPIPQINHPLRGRLLVELNGSAMESFIDHFLQLKQEYEELVMVGVYEHRLAALFEENLKYLGIGRCKRTWPDQYGQTTTSWNIFVSRKQRRSLVLHRTPPTGNRYHMSRGAGVGFHLVYCVYKLSKARLETPIICQRGVLGESSLDIFRQYYLWARRQTVRIGIQEYLGSRISCWVCNIR